MEWHATTMLKMVQKGYLNTYQGVYAPPDGVGRIVVSLSYQAVGMLGEVGGGVVGGAVSGAVNGAVNGGVSGGANGAVSGAVSGAGQALSANAKPFNPGGALRRKRGAEGGSLVGSRKALAPK